MKYVKLGESDLSVSRICLGCMGFGDAKSGQHSWTLDEEHSREIIARGLELTQEEIEYLEECYTPHPLVGVMAQNKPENFGKKQVWGVGNQKL